MPTTITGNSATGHGNPIAFSAPSSGDAVASGAMDTALQALADLIALFQAQGARLDLANSFTQTALFQAAVTLQALLTLNTSGISLTAAVAQSILKTAAGGLAIGTGASGGDFSLQAGGATLLKLLAAGSMDAQGKTLTNLAVPASATDAARKDMGGTTLNNLGAPAAAADAMRYGDSFAAPTITAPTLNSGWTPLLSALAFSYWKDRVGVVHLKGGAIYATGGGASVVTLPAGYRPANSRVSPAIDQTTGTLVVVTVGLDGTVTMGSTTNAHTYMVDGITFLAE